LIGALSINLDLMRNQDDIKGWMVSSLVNKWAVDQLIDNAVSVRLGNKSMEFIKLSNGSYAAPPGLKTPLVIKAGRRMTARITWWRSWIPGSTPPCFSMTALTTSLWSLTTI